MTEKASFERAFHAAIGDHVDIKAFTKEFLHLQGGMTGLAKLLHEQIHMAANGGMAKTMLLKMAVGLLEKAHEGDRSAKALSELDPVDFQAAFRELAGDQGLQSLMKAALEAESGPPPLDEQDSG